MIVTIPLAILALQFSPPPAAKLVPSTTTVSDSRCSSSQGTAYLPFKSTFTCTH